MLTKPDSKTIAAIARLVKTQDGEELTKFIDSELEALKDSLIDAADEQKYLRQQGRGRALKELLDVLRSAQDILEKTRTRGN